MSLHQETTRLPHKPIAGANRRSYWAASSLVVTAVAASAVLAAMFLTWNSIVAVGSDLSRALWLLPLLVALQLFQLCLAGIAWRALCPASRLTWPMFYRLRIVREGIDSLLPVAQVGGEIIGARLLAQRGMAGSLAGASVVVDVTVELLTHVVFLICGLAVVAVLSPAEGMQFFTLAAVAGLTAVGLLLAQRLGGLRLIEVLLVRLASHWPALAAMSSLAGLHDATLRLYRQPSPMLRCIGLHQAAWFLGSLETWAVLHVLGTGASPLQAFAVESLGMAARSAGFAIPGALGLQEGGFVLAAMAVGLPATSALALSLIKRLREISVGMIGLALWRLEAGRHRQ